MNKSLQFRKNGFVIFKSLVNDGKIETLLNVFENFKQKNSIYYSQSQHNWRRTLRDLDEYGLLRFSIEDFTNLIWAPEIAKAGREILLSEEIASALSEISGSSEDYAMWQNMFFDKSTGTIDHIDTWYLDTDPMGHLIAAWIALEDIDGRGGSFHVYPGSHLEKDHSWKTLDHNQFVSWSKKIGKSYAQTPILIKKGDVLFWHPSLLHGSSDQQIQGCSRKSLTAHYYPISIKRGGRGVLTDPDTELYRESIRLNFKGIRTYGKLPIYGTRNRLNVKYSLNGLKQLLRKTYNYEHLLMSRSAYE